LVADIGSFLALYGWYFALLGPAGGLVSLDSVFFLAAVGDGIYAAAGLLIGCAVLLQTAGIRLGSGHPR